MSETPNNWNATDLGLSYMQAVHGVQSATAYAMEVNKVKGLTHPADPKHLRVGIDMTKAEIGGLAMLLINKGVFTLEEYHEAMRIAANTELAMREKENPGMTFR